MPFDRSDLENHVDVNTFYHINSYSCVPYIILITFGALGQILGQILLEINLSGRFLIWDKLHFYGGKRDSPLAPLVVNLEELWLLFCIKMSTLYFQNKLKEQQKSDKTANIIFYWKSVWPILYSSWSLTSYKISEVIKVQKSWRTFENQFLTNN